MKSFPSIVLFVIFAGLMIWAGSILIDQIREKMAGGKCSEAKIALNLPCK